MQKIFRKYMILITTAAILSILVIHYHLSMYFLESQQLNTFNTKISQIIRTLEANRSAQASAQSGPDEDYLTIFLPYMFRQIKSSPIRTVFFPHIWKNITGLKCFPDAKTVLIKKWRITKSITLSQGTMETC